MIQSPLTSLVQAKSVTIVITTLNITKINKTRRYFVYWCVLIMLIAKTKKSYLEHEMQIP
jgi:Na+/H+ antiporter NhaA